MKKVFDRHPPMFREQVDADALRRARRDVPTGEYHGV